MSEFIRSSPRDVIEILGVPFARHDVGSAIEALVHLYEDERPHWVAVTNSHGLNLTADDPGYREVLRSAGLVLNDGKGVMLAALLQGKKFPADLNGNAIGPLLVRTAADRCWPVYLLGARPGVAERVADKLRAVHPELMIVGTRNGYFSASEEPGIVDEIRRSGAGLLLVALGNPAQEYWLHKNLVATGAQLGIGIGAFFDFTAGEVQRAPAWLNRLALEWVYRLAKEPRRLWRRYLLGHPRFVARVVRERIARLRRTKPPHKA